MKDLSLSSSSRLNVALLLWLKKKTENCQRIQNLILIEMCRVKLMKKKERSRLPLSVEADLFHVRSLSVMY